MNFVQRTFAEIAEMLTFGYRSGALTRETHAREWAEHLGATPRPGANEETHMTGTENIEPIEPNRH